MWLLYYSRIPSSGRMQHLRKGLGGTNGTSFSQTNAVQAINWCAQQWYWELGSRRNEFCNLFLTGETCFRQINLPPISSGVCWWRKYSSGVRTRYRVWKNVRRDTERNHRSGPPNILQINMNAARIQRMILGQSSDILEVVNYKITRKCLCLLVRMLANISVQFVPVRKF